MKNVIYEDYYYKDLIKHYKLIKHEKNRLPTTHDFDDEENKRIKQYFKSVSGLAVYLGDEPDHGNMWIPDDVFITEIRQLANKLGYPPHSKDYPRATSANNRFHTNWQGVIHHCGIIATYPASNSNSQISKQEVIYKTKKAMKDLDYSYLPEWKELQTHGVSVSSIFNYWDSLSDFRKELEVPSKSEYVWSKREAEMRNAVQTLVDSETKVNIADLMRVSNLKHWEIDQLLRKYGGLKRYITKINA